MFYSYTGGRNYYGQLTNDTTSGNLTNGDTHINASISHIIGQRPWPFLYREGTAATVASQQHVVVPRNYAKLTSVKVTQGTTVWTPREAPNREFWDRLNSQTASSNTSDIPEWYYFFNGRCYFSPTPATTGNTVTFFGKIGFRGLSIADYTTGSVGTATNLGTAIGGVSTVWTQSMVGRYIKITESNTDNKGDGEWYEVSGFTSTTSISIAKPYLGIAITAGTAAYTIGQISPIPEEYGEAPIVRAASIYYGSKTTPGSGTKAKEYMGMYEQMMTQMQSDYGAGTDNVLIEEESLDDEVNPNLVVRL